MRGGGVRHGGRREARTGLHPARWLAVVLALPALAMPAPGAAQLSGPTRELSLTLNDTVRLALRSNHTLLSARHQRTVQKFSLDVSDDRYRPRASIGTSVRDGSTVDPTADLFAGPSLRIPTGGEFSLMWSQPLAGGDDRRGAWMLGFSQPLLKGFGPRIDAAPLRIARIGEEKNVLSFRDTITRVIVSVITAYRSVIRAHHAITISRESLARAERQLDVNRSLISAGRLATRETVQTEVELANRRLALVESRNGLISANASLISLLDIDGVASIRPAAELPPVDPVSLDSERGIETALANRSDYLRALLSREEAQIGLELTKDERRWNLALTTRVSGSSGGEGDFSTGLALAIPLGERAPRLAVLRAKNALRDAEIALVELRQSIRIAVRQAVNDVEVGFRRVELAHRARELAEQQVEVEQEKLSQGLTSTFQLSAVEDGLVAAKTRELDATIAYLNALTSLERTLGTTLPAWGIDLEAYEPEPSPALGRDARQANDGPMPATPRVGGVAWQQFFAPGSTGRTASASDAPRNVHPTVARTFEAQRLAADATSLDPSPFPFPAAAKRPLLLSLRDFDRMVLIAGSQVQDATSGRIRSPAGYDSDAAPEPEHRQAASR